jgi:hypothetical protein
MTWQEFSNSEWVPENERGFWYPGVMKRLVEYRKAAHFEILKEYQKSLVLQIYNTSPLLSGLLASAS